MSAPESPGAMDSAALAQRYGTARPGRRRLVVALVAVLGLVAGGWIAWVVSVEGRPMVRSNLVFYSTAGNHQVSTRFTVVRRSTEVTARCVVRAFAADHSVVGELNVPVGPGGTTQSTLARTVRTERAATSVEMVGCTAPGQDRPR